MKRSILVVVLALGLAGCGGASSSPSAADAGAGSSVPAVSSTPSEPVAASTGADGSPVVAADFCAFLTEVEKDVVSAGSPSGSLATMSIALSAWIEGHPEQKPRFAEDLDTASVDECPGPRQKILAALGEPSFDDAF